MLRDAYLDIDERQVPALIDVYLAERADAPDPGAFRERFDIVSAQRMIKALGSFGYLIAVRGRPRYEAAIPRTLARLERLLPAHAETAALHGHLKRAGVL